MKITETSGGMFAIVQGIECRLTVKARNKYAMAMKDNGDLMNSFVDKRDGAEFAKTLYVMGKEKGKKEAGQKMLRILGLL